VKFLLDDLRILSLADTVPEIKDAHRDFPSLLLESAKESAHKPNHILGSNILDTRAVGIADGCKTATLH
jgi:hypothetical protein